MLFAYGSTTPVLCCAALCAFVFATVIPEYDSMGNPLEMTWAVFQFVEVNSPAWPVPEAVLFQKLVVLAVAAVTFAPLARSWAILAVATDVVGFCAAPPFPVPRPINEP